jgi:hypothetical protein
MDVQNNVVAVCEDAFDFAVVVGKLLAQKSQKCFQAFRPVRRPRVVLDVARADELHGGVEIFLINRGLVELLHALFVFFDLSGVGRVGGRSERDQYGSGEPAEHGEPPGR